MQPHLVTNISEPKTKDRYQSEFRYFIFSQVVSVPLIPSVSGNIHVIGE